MHELRVGTSADRAPVSEKEAKQNGRHHICHEISHIKSRSAQKASVKGFMIDEGLDFEIACSGSKMKSWKCPV